MLAGAALAAPRAAHAAQERTPAGASATQAPEERATDATGAAGEANDAGRAVFALACASCHGHDGSGQGTTVLDRPARSFKDGGFSFGNTPEALFRTISTGIPGTPMPAFGEAFTEDQLRAVARYVVSLAPPVTEVTLSETELVVLDRAVVVQGILPPIADGALLTPRGLLVGTPEGLTFAYRLDDVRLLCVRQGAFVQRTDWTGRGGTPLEALGLVAWRPAGLEPQALFALAVPAPDRLALVHSPLRARYLGSQERGSDWLLRYTLQSETGRTLAEVEETARALHSALGWGFLRSLHVTPARDADIGGSIGFLSGAPVGPEAGVENWAGQIARSAGWIELKPDGSRVVTACVPRTNDWTWSAVSLTAPDDAVASGAPEVFEMQLLMRLPSEALSGRAEYELDVATLVTTSADDGTVQALLAELQR